jgi:hypothetical protein
MSSFLITLRVYYIKFIQIKRRLLQSMGVHAISLLGTIISQSMEIYVSQEFHIDPIQRMKYQSPKKNHFYDIEQLKLDIVMPIHRPAHWIAAVISFSSGTIFIKDGLFNDQTKIAEIVMQWYASKLRIQLFIILINTYRYYN